MEHYVFLMCIILFICFYILINTYTNDLCKQDSQHDITYNIYSNTLENFNNDKNTDVIKKHGIFQYFTSKSELEYKQLMKK